MGLFIAPSGLVLFNLSSDIQRHCGDQVIVKEVYCRRPPFRALWKVKDSMVGDEVHLHL